MKKVEVLKALAMAGFGFLFYKLLSWWTNAPSYIAVIASVFVIFIMWLVTEKVSVSKGTKK